MRSPSRAVRIGVCFWLMCASLVVTAARAFAQPSVAGTEQRTIVNLHGDLYEARFDGLATLFLVTPDGILMTDPLGREAATWLRGEFARRFPGVPVRYVLISHHHFDRAEGASVFGGAETIAHRLFNEEMASLRSSAVYIDVTPAKRTFDVRERITLGGRAVEMIYAGPVHARDMAVFYFPDERVIFAVDTLNVDRSPYSFDRYSPFDVAALLDLIVGLDADLIVDGTGKTIGTKDLRVLQPYVRDLVEAVAAGVAAGRTLGQLRSTVLLPAHRANPNYAGRVSQIASVYRSLSVRSLNLSLAGSESLLSTQTSYCAGFSICNPLGGRVAGGTIGLDYWRGRVGVGAEFATGDQLVVSRSSTLYDDALANRRSTTSIFARYRMSQARIGADALFGLTAAASDTQGLDVVREALAPLGGRHPIESSRWFPGIIAGLDVVIPAGSRWSVRLPVRFVYVETGGETLHPGQTGLQVGAGLSYSLTKRVVREHGQEQPIVVRSRPSAPAKQP